MTQLTKKDLEKVLSSVPEDTPIGFMMDTNEIFTFIYCSPVHTEYINSSTGQTERGLIIKIE